MTEATSGTDGAPGAERHVDPAVAAQEAEVARQREQLADTVDALQARLDVKARAQDGVRNAKARVGSLGGGARLVLAGVALAAGLGVVVWRRRR